MEEFVDGFSGFLNVNNVIINLKSYNFLLISLFLLISPKCSMCCVPKLESVEELSVVHTLFFRRYMFLPWEILGWVFLLVQLFLF